MNYTQASLQQLHHLKDALRKAQEELIQQIDSIDRELAARQGQRVSAQLRQVFGLKEVIAYCGWCGAPQVEDEKYCSMDCADYANYDQLENMATGN